MHFPSCHAQGTDGKITSGNMDHTFDEFHSARSRANNQSFTMVSSWTKFERIEL